MASSPSLLSPLSTFKSIPSYPIQPSTPRFIAKTWHTSITTKPRISRINSSSNSKNSRAGTELSDQNDTPTIECIGTGSQTECIVDTPTKTINMSENEANLLTNEENLGNGWFLSVNDLWEWVVLISPFFFWGTAMVAMKEVIPKVGPFSVAAFRLIPAGMLLIGFAGYKGRRMPSGFNAWLSITLFALVDATCFQGFLAEGLQKTAAGLGSVIIDSQPLTVAILAALFFGESIGYVGATGLVLGVVGLLLLEVQYGYGRRRAGKGDEYSVYFSGLAGKSRRQGR